MYLLVYLVAFHVSFLGEPSPTNGTPKWLLRRMGENVTLKFCPPFEFFPAKWARKTDRILGMLNFMVFRNFVFPEVGFFTTGKCAGYPRSIHCAVDVVNMPLQMVGWRKSLVTNIAKWANLVAMHSCHMARKGGRIFWKLSANLENIIIRIAY